MGRIQRLSALEAQKIAAGQVVERPVNVVKELVENACDAGATDLLLELEDGGKKRICIVDNGSGMSPDDARLSIEKHTTSKITSIDDLAHITTFGFRGEALASIAAVSRMMLTTREIDQLHATQLTIADGTIVGEISCAHNAGTRIDIRDLFYNMPARQKFLKKRDTEWHQIYHFLQAFCLSHHEVSVTVLHDKKKVLHAPAVASLRDRCAQLWSHDMVRELIDLEYTHLSDDLSIHGVISNHQHARYDRSSIFFFVNNRWVQNTALTRSLLKAYQNVLPMGRYPVGCIFITIDSREIDINIHPKKEEITFLHPRMIERYIQDSVQKALEQHLSSHATPQAVQLSAGLLPDGSIQRMRPFAPYSTHQFHHIPDKKNSNTDMFLRASHATNVSNLGHESVTFHNNTTPDIQDVSHESAHQNVQHQLSATEPEPKLIGQYATTYILVERADGLWMVDQHAAHERILYESFAQANYAPVTIQLIVPHCVTLARDQLARLEPHLDILRSNGFGVAIIGEDQLVISSTPVHAKTMALNELIQQCISWIMEYQSYTAEEFSTVINHHMRAQMACKAAVKAGDMLSHQEMIDIVDRLEKTPNKLTCPHGRPTGWLMSLYEIEKKFKRKV